jgi:hypothetical protein
MIGASDLHHLAIDVFQHLVYGFELGDGVLVDLSLLVHEVLQFYTKRSQIRNGCACIKLRSTLPVVEVRQIPLPHVVKNLSFLRAILVDMDIFSALFTCGSCFGSLYVLSLFLFYLLILQPSHKQMNLAFEYVFLLLLQDSFDVPHGLNRK